MNKLSNGVDTVNTHRTSAGGASTLPQSKLQLLRTDLKRLVVSTGLRTGVGPVDSLCAHGKSV